MRHHRPSVYRVYSVSRNAPLIGTHRRNNVERPRVDLLATVAHDADDDLLPTVRSPGFTAIPFTQIRNVLHDAVHGPCE